jgi:hypothetical protein
MNSILQTNIFFFITGLAIVAVSAVFVVALVYVIRILRDVRHIARVLRAETDRIEEDISKFRASIREEGMRWKQIFRFVTSWISEWPQGAKRGGGRKKTNNKNNKEE